MRECCGGPRQRSTSAPKILIPSEVGQFDVTGTLLVRYWYVIGTLLVRYCKLWSHLSIISSEISFKERYIQIHNGTLHINR